jgi:hypothetical protein
MYRIFIWFAEKWARQDSNLRPTGYEPAALPLSYEPTLSPMKSFTFHGHPICVERETGLEPATPCLEGVTATQSRFTHHFEPEKREKTTSFSN